MAKRKVYPQDTATSDPQATDVSNVMKEVSSPVESAALDFLTSEQAVSSERTKLESLTGEAREAEAAGIKAAEISRSASAERITGSFGRDTAEAARGASIQLSTLLESRRGFATSRAAIEDLRATSDKTLKDLEQRKSELLLQNDAQAASQISQLQFQTLQFNQNANQQYFSNLLGIAGIEQSAKQFGLQERAQIFQEKQAMNQIQLEFGVSGNTLDEVIENAIPLASDERALRLQQIRSQIAASNASARVARQKLARGESLANASSSDLLLLGMTSSDLYDKGATFKALEGMEEAHKLMDESTIDDIIKDGLELGDSSKDIIQNTRNNETLTSLTPDERELFARAKIKGLNISVEDIKSGRFTLKHLAGIIGAAEIKAVKGIAEFLGARKDIHGKPIITNKEITEARKRWVQ